jgi:hypothetical protein
MSKPAPSPIDDLVPVPDVDHLVTEDDTPVDNVFSEKQQRLLTEPLYSSWAGPGPGRPFLAMANVGLFPTVHRPAIVPDMLLSLDVQAPEEMWEKRHRSYFIWEFGKPPEVVVEVVSNREGNETGSKMTDYARIGVAYYVVFDPQHLVQAETLRVFELHAGRYVLRPDAELPEVGLRLVLWAGEFETARAEWLRFADRDGVLIPTGAERAAAERAKADSATARADRLAARLRALGLDPDADA